MELERILFNTIKVNCIERIDKKSFICINNTNSAIEIGAYFNLFNDRIYDLETNPNEFKQVIHKELLSSKPQLKPNNIDKTIEFFSQLKLKSMSRFLNIGKLSKEFQFSEEIAKRVKRLENEEIFFHIKSRGDGNCFYR